MRTEQEVRSSSNDYNATTINQQLIHEIRNSAFNHAKIIEAFKSGRAKDIADMNDVKAKGKPCIIVGSGPSLDVSIEKMKGWKGGIICTTSHASTLMHAGIEPTYILALDPFARWEDIWGIDWKNTRTKLIAHPGCHQGLIENWPNEMAMYLENLGKRDTYYATTQKQMYSYQSSGSMRDCTFTFYIRTEIVIFACSPPMQAFVAKLLGYGALVLAGCDFGFSKEKERFTDWKMQPVADSDKYDWIKTEHPYIPNEEKDIVGNNGVITQDVHLYYKKNFFSAWRLAHQTMYTTDTGLITEIPYISMEEAVEKQDSLPEQEDSFIDTVTDKYLASVGAYIVQTEKNGMAFCEAQYPLTELYEYMEALNNSYVCTTCHTPYLYKPDGNGRPLACPHCKAETLIQSCPIDILGNMKRFKRLVHEAATVALPKTTA